MLSIALGLLRARLRQSLVAAAGVATGVVGPSLPPQAASTASAAMLRPRA